METRTEITNEAMAEALGWKIAKGNRGFYHPPHRTDMICELPNFINDLNVQEKYLWPKMGPKKVADIILVALTFHANLAPIIAEAFMEMKYPPPVLDITDEQAKEFAKLAKPGEIKVYDAS